VNGIAKYAEINTQSLYNKWKKLQDKSEKKIRERSPSPEYHLEKKKQKKDDSVLIHQNKNGNENENEKKSKRTEDTQVVTDKMELNDENDNQANVVDPEKIEIKKEFNVKKQLSEDDTKLINYCIAEVKLHWKQAKEIDKIETYNPKISEKVFEYDAENSKTNGLIKLFICTDEKEIWIQGWEKKKPKNSTTFKYKLLNKTVLPLKVQRIIEEFVTVLLSGFKTFKKKQIILEKQAAFPEITEKDEKNVADKIKEFEKEPLLEVQGNANLQNFVTNNQLKFSLIKYSSKLNILVKDNEQVQETEYFGKIQFCWRINGIWKQKLLIKAGDLLDFGSGNETYKGTFICVSKGKSAVKPNFFYFLIENKNSPSKNNNFEIKKTTYSNLSQIIVDAANEVVLSRNNDLFIEFLTNEMRNDIKERKTFEKEETMYIPVEKLDKANQKEMEEFKKNTMNEIGKISDLLKEMRPITRILNDYSKENGMLKSILVSSKYIDNFDEVEKIIHNFKKK